MKSIIVAVIGAGILIGMAFYMHRQSAPVSTPEPVVEAVSTQLGSARMEAISTAQKPTRRQEIQAVSPSRGTSAVPGKAKLDAAMLNEKIELLVSPQVPYGNKQAVWNQLRDLGKLDQVISELEARMAANPNAAELSAALGQAYLKKCSGLKDVREQAILGMQADKLLDVALDLDPSNWEARFMKAVALAHWPVGMNKEQEVIQHFQFLIQQQETQTPQPEFAESYLWLGKQYEKSGQSDYARAVWERGAGLFPNHDGLKGKLAALNAGPNPAVATGLR